MKAILDLAQGQIRFNEPLYRHTAFRIGGRAGLWFEPKDAADLSNVIKLLSKIKRKFIVIGAGSNLLINDKGLDTVISLASPFFKQLESRGNYIWAGAGVYLNKLVEFARDSGLGGAEFLSGIPATVGGAVVMNAGMLGENIGDLAREVLVMDTNGKTKIIKKKDLKFGYRHSNLSKYIVLKIRLRLQKKGKSEVNNRIREFLNYRKNHLDLSGPSAGCIFQNPKGSSAGRLIELCGLKRMRIGGAYISDKHANFIINSGRATAKDVLRLIELVKNRVEDKFGICLKPEIRIFS